MIILIEISIIDLWVIRLIVSYGLCLCNSSELVAEAHAT